MNVHLRPMTEPEFRTFKQYSILDYAQSKRDGEGMTEEEAQEIAEKSFAELLPSGIQSENQFLFCILENDRFVGYLWYAIQEKKSGRQAYLYNIDITPNERGKGFGEAAMILLEQEVKKKGLKKIGLHVFGFNTRAQSLYEKLGYSPTNIIMVKHL